MTCILFLPLLVTFYYEFVQNGIKSDIKNRIVKYIVPIVSGWGNSTPFSNEIVILKFSANFFALCIKDESRLCN